MDDIVNDMEVRRKKEFDHYKELVLRKIELMKWEGYREEYSFELMEMYDVYEGSEAVDKPA